MYSKIVPALFVIERGTASSSKRLRNIVLRALRDTVYQVARISALVVGLNIKKELYKNINDFIIIIEYQSIPL